MLSTPIDLEATTIAGPDDIPPLRDGIDALDNAIIRLVRERKRLSRRAQEARIAAGGVRIEHGREREVLDRYRNALPDDGAGALLADTILRVCRGPVLPAK